MSVDRPNDSDGLPQSMPAPSPKEDRFNLSAWALRHQALVIFLITLATLAGILAYTRLA